MESICKILENFYASIYPVRFCRYSDQDCIFIVHKSPIKNQGGK